MTDGHKTMVVTMQLADLTAEESSPVRMPAATVTALHV
jgi:hypothetical protein